jgi:hypothetical protein
MDGATDVDAWLYFPGIKVGKTFISLLPFCLFGGVDYILYYTDSTEYDYS